MLRFTKMTGLGNDYIYIDCTNNKKIENVKEIAKKFSDRHFGVGSDGIILIEDSDIADFKMRIFNSDGSEAEMCGNGIRCVGKYVYDKHFTDKEEISVETLAGVKSLQLFCNDGICKEVKVDMGEPAFKDKDLPTIADEEITKDLKIKVKDKELRFTLVSMGNPHAVTFVEDIENIPLEQYGPIIENNEMFPNRTNVEFVQIDDKNNIKMRVWERGAGETLACGTGACASVVAGGINGYTDSDVTVELLGGKLNIKWDDNNHIYMTGPATKVFEGEIEI